VERVEGVDSAQAAFAKELDRVAIDATVLALLATEFATGTENPPAFESYEFVEDQVTLLTQ
jgi:hypothetical protein